MTLKIWTALAKRQSAFWKEILRRARTLEERQNPPLQDDPELCRLQRRIDRHVARMARLNALWLKHVVSVGASATRLN